VGGGDGYFVAEVLQADCCVGDEALGAANTEVRVEEDYILGSGLWSGFITQPIDTLGLGRF